MPLNVRTHSEVAPVESADGMEINTRRRRRSRRSHGTNIFIHEVRISMPESEDDKDSLGRFVFDDSDRIVLCNFVSLLVPLLTLVIVAILLIYFTVHELKLYD